MDRLQIGRPILVRLPTAPVAIEGKEEKIETYPRRLLHPDETWTETKNYWVSPYPARSMAWFWARYGRLSGSHIGGALGWVPWATPEQTARAIWGEERALDAKGRYHTSRGIRMEPVILQALSQALGLPLEELNFIVSRHNPLMGYTCDAVVRDGDRLTNVEAKAPDELPRDLATHLYRLGWDGRTIPWQPKETIPYEQLNYDHISSGHYGQFQYGCDLLDATDNIYAVGVERRSLLYLERVPRDRPFAARMFGELSSFMGAEYKAAAPREEGG